MKYLELCEVYDLVQTTSSRLEKTRIISQLLQKADKDLQRIVLLLQGRVRPAWQKETMGVSAKLMLQALARVTGASKQEINNSLRKHGDLGLVAELLSDTKTQQTLFGKQLSVEYVHKQLKKLATIQGNGSVDQKIKIISELVSHASPLEARYITRTVLEELRIGIASGTIRDAIIYAFLSKQAGIQDTEIVDRDAYNQVSKQVQSAYDKTNDFSQVALAAKQGIQEITAIQMQIGVPLKVMLGIRAKNATQAINKLETPVLLQYKYDGFRVEIHKQGQEVQIFTRRLEDVTTQFPDIVKLVLECVDADSCILDAEATGIDPQTGAYKPFQEISQRIRRKYDIEKMAKKLPVDVRVFDIMYLNKEELLNTPLHTRHELLEKHITNQELFGVAQTLITSDTAQAEEFFITAKKAGTEGLFAKKYDSTYEPGVRVGNWMKIKDTMEPLDVVIIGAHWGEGKRSGWLTSFEIAIIDEQQNLLPIGKVGTGLKELSDQGFSFKEITDLLSEHIISQEGKHVQVSPHIIVEVAYEEIQKSPSYESGYALRFPRILRNRSDERDVEDITTLHYVEELYRLQNE